VGAVGSEHVHELRLERFGLAVHPRVAHHDATVGGDREVAHVLTAVTTGERADRLAAGVDGHTADPSELGLGPARVEDEIAFEGNGIVRPSENGDREGGQHGQRTSDPRRSQSHFRRGSDGLRDRVQRDPACGHESLHCRSGRSVRTCEDAISVISRAESTASAAHEPHA